MELGPIFRALLNHRTRFWLVTIEIALTLAIVANCMTMVIDQRSRLMRPTGIDEKNILVATVEPFAREFDDRSFLLATYDEDLRAIRQMPGVHKATAMHAIPLSGGGSATGRKAAGAEIDTLGTPYYVVGRDAVGTLGLKLAEGRDFVDSDFPVRTTGEPDEEERGNNVILTRAMADLLFPDGGALGSQIESGGDDPTFDTIVGIVERMQCSWPMSSVAERGMLIPGDPANERRTRYVVRVEPGARDRLFKALEDKLLALNEGRIVTVRTLSDIKAETYASLVAFSQLLGGLSILLVIVTSLGIVGLTSFSVTQRTHEIGTRRALGATRWAILRYFLVENWVVTATGLTLGLALTLALNFALAHWASVPRINALHVVIGMLVLWGAGLLSALAPAIRGAAVSPVIATRNVY